MKTGIVTACLVVLLFGVAGLWAIQEAAPQEQQVRGWGTVDFIRGTARELWRDAGSQTSERWTKPGCGERPNAVITRISSVRRVFASSYNRRAWEAILEINAGSERDLVLVGAYIRRCYTHVEIFRTTGQQP